MFVGLTHAQGAAGAKSKEHLLSYNIVTCTFRKFYPGWMYSYVTVLRKDLSMTFAIIRRFWRTQLLSRLSFLRLIMSRPTLSCLTFSRLTMAALAIVLAFSPYSLWAQRGGGRGGHGSPAGAAKGEPAEDDELKNFNRAVALQATPQQVDLFQQLAKDTTAAAAKSENLLQHPEKMKEDAGILAYVVEVARDSSHDFLAGLSHPQRSGLKAWRKNVEKADADVGRSWKALSRDLAEKAGDDKRIAADNDKLQKALAKSLNEQWNLAEKMGIPPPRSDTHDHSSADGVIEVRSTLARNS